MDKYDVRAAIRKRTSVRRYVKREVPGELLDDVIRAGAESVPLDISIPVRFHLARDAGEVARRMPVITGGKLIFSTAPHFIIAVSEDRPLFLSNLGYRMEQMMLYATHLGLGTCWIGGMFNEKQLQSWLGLQKHERVVAITPVGYASESALAHIEGDIVGSFAKMRGKRKTIHQIACGPVWNSPLVTEDKSLLEILECVRLAPSSVNSQPWRFLVGDDDIIIVADPPRYGRIGIPFYKIDMGIAMAHLNFAAAAVGWGGKLEINGFNPRQIAVERKIPAKCEIFGIYSRNAA